MNRYIGTAIVKNRITNHKDVITTPVEAESEAEATDILYGYGDGRNNEVEFASAVELDSFIDKFND